MGFIVVAPVVVKKMIKAFSLKLFFFSAPFHSNVGERYCSLGNNGSQLKLHIEIANLKKYIDVWVHSSEGFFLSRTWIWPE